MKKLLVYMKKYKKESILAPLFKMLEASFELLIPVVVKMIVDVGIANGDKTYVAKMCLVMVALGIIGLVCSVTAQYYSAKAAVGVSTKIRHDMFERVQAFSYTQTDKIGTSTIVTRLTSDINQVQNGINMVLRLFLRSPFIVVGAMVMAFFTDPTSAWIFVIVIPFLSIVVFGIMYLTIPLYKKVQSKLDNLLGITRGNLAGVRVLRAFQKEEEEMAQFGESNDELTTLQKMVGRISAIMNPVTYVIVNGAGVALLWVGAIRVDGGLITQGAVIALVNYMSQILVELIKLANLIVTVNKAIACSNRVFGILEVEPDMHGGEAVTGTESEWVVEFNHVSQTYEGAGAASLTDIDFKVRAGETVGVIGGTGSGKTSLVNLIPRFYNVTEGEVKIAGVQVEEYDLKTLRDMVGVVPQKAVLFKGTIRENLYMGNEKASEEELREALLISQAMEFVESKSDGMETQISQNGRNLSGGQRQRLTIARALVKQPQILILDDSTSALDFATEAKLRQALAGMRNSMTVFIVSQRASSLMHADKIIVLDDGAMVGNGTHQELLATCEIYQEIYYSQFPEKRLETV